MFVSKIPNYMINQRIQLETKSGHFKLQQVCCINMGIVGSRNNQNGVLLETLADYDKSINCMVLSDDGSMTVTGSEGLTEVNQTIWDRMYWNT